MDNFRTQKFKAGKFRRTRRLLAIMLVASLLMSACSPMDLLPDTLASRLEGLLGRPDRPGVGIGSGEDRYFTCDDVVLGAKSGRPTNTIGLGAIPTDFGPLPALRVVDPKSGDFVIAPVRGGPGRSGADFVVPLHPNNTPEGGPVTLTLFDGDGEDCSPLDFTIEPLPDAPGAFQEFVEVLSRAYEGTRGQFPPPAPEGEADSPMMSPFDIVEDRLKGPENPNSLENIAAGTSELDLTPEAQRIMDGLIDESGVIDAWEQWAEELEGLPEVPPVWHDDPPSGPPDFPWPEGPPGGDWDPVCDKFWHSPNAAVLSALMRGQSVGSKVQDVAGPFMGATSSLATVVSLGSMLFTGGVPNPVTVASAAIGTGISVADILTEMTEKLLPGELTQLTFNYDKPLYLEDDEDLSGYWDEVMLTASSEGMSFDGIILNILLSKAGGLVAKGFVGKHFDLEVLQKAVEFQGELVGGGAASMVMEKYGDSRGLMFLPGCDFGPVDISDEAYHYAEFVPADGPAVITEHQAYEIVDVGDADLEIHVIAEKFGGHTLSQVGPVLVKPIKVTIDPEKVEGDPGYTATFLVTIEDANNTGASFTLRPTGAHRMETEFIEPNMYEVTVFTSENSRDFSSTLFAESISFTGLRAWPDAPPRQAAAILSSGGSVDVSPGTACVERDNTLQFSAVVTGYENEDVIWEASGGSVNASGLFTAPDRDGEYAVRAVSVADAKAYGEARVRVAERCVCWASVELPSLGIASTTTDLTMAMGSTERDRGDELQRVDLDFTEAGADFNGVLNLEFFHDLWQKGEGSTVADVVGGWEFFDKLRSHALGTGDGTYETGDHIYYNITYNSDDTLEYFRIPIDATKGTSYRKQRVYVSPEVRRDHTGPRVGSTDRAGLKVTTEAGGPVVWSDAQGREVSNFRYSSGDPGRRIETVAIIERDLWGGPFEGRVHDRHVIRYEERDVKVNTVYYDLPVIMTVEEFTDEGDGVLWLKGVVEGEVAIEDGGDYFIRGPIRAEIQGRFGAPTSIFGDGRDVFLFDRWRDCLLP